MVTTASSVKPPREARQGAVVENDWIPQFEADNMNYDEEIVTKQFKVIILGDGAVGKSSICARFANETFSQTYKQTIGVDFFVKRIHLPRKSFPSTTLFLIVFFLPHLL